MQAAVIHNIDHTNHQASVCPAAACLPSSDQSTQQRQRSVQSISGQLIRHLSLCLPSACRNVGLNAGSRYLTEIAGNNAIVSLIAPHHPSCQQGTWSPGHWAATPPTLHCAVASNGSSGLFCLYPPLHPSLHFPPCWLNLKHKSDKTGDKHWFSQATLPF